MCQAAQSPLHSMGVKDTLPKLTFVGTSSGDLGARHDLTTVSRRHKSGDLVSNIQEHEYLAHVDFYIHSGAFFSSVNR